MPDGMGAWPWRLPRCPETYTPRLIILLGQLTLAARRRPEQVPVSIRSMLLAVPPVMTLMPRSRDQAIVGTVEVARQNWGWGL